PNSMAQPCAAFLKFGNWSVCRPWRIIALLCQIAESFCLTHHLEHMLSVILPVCCEVKYATCNQFPTDFLHTCRLHNASLMVLLFMSWIREVSLQSITAGIWKTIFQAIHGIGHIHFQLS